MVRIGWRLNELLTSRGESTSKADLERRTGLHRNILARILEDTTARVDFSTLACLCNRLNATPNDLLLNIEEESHKDE